jgi:hypothetical protein
MNISNLKKGKDTNKGKKSNSGSKSGVKDRSYTGGKMESVTRGGPNEKPLISSQSKFGSGSDHGI